MAETTRRCVFQFTVEWAMWGNMNALYAAVCKCGRLASYGVMFLNLHVSVFKGLAFHVGSGLASWVP